MARNERSRKARASASHRAVAVLTFVWQSRMFWEVVLSHRPSAGYAAEARYAEASGWRVTRGPGRPAPPQPIALPHGDGSEDRCRQGGADFAEPSRAAVRSCLRALEATSQKRDFRRKATSLRRDFRRKGKVCVSEERVCRRKRRYSQVRVEVIGAIAARQRDGRRRRGPSGTARYAPPVRLGVARHRFVPR